MNEKWNNYDVREREREIILSENIRYLICYIFGYRSYSKIGSNEREKERAI